MTTNIYLLIEILHMNWSSIFVILTLNWLNNYLPIFLLRLEIVVKFDLHNVKRSK